MHLIIQYTLALANLYGIYDRTLLLDIYNRQNNENVKPDELSKHFKDAAFALKKAKIVLKGQQIIKAEIIEDDFYDELMRLKQGKRYYIPEREVLLNYQDEGYIEPSSQYEVVKAFVKRYIGDDFSETADQIAHKVAIMCRNCTDPQHILDYISNFQIAFDLEANNAMLEAIGELYNASRNWENNGCKPNDMSALDLPEGELKGSMHKIAHYIGEMDAFYNINQSYIVGGWSSYKLVEQLERYTVAQLKRITKLFGIRRVSTFRKAELIEVLVEVIKEEASLYLPNALSDLEPHEMEILKEALKSDFVVVEEEFLFLKQLLIMIGCAQISFLEGNYYYAIADEIKPIIKSILKTKSFRDEYYLKRVSSLLKNIAMMYGVLSIEDAMALIRCLEPELSAKKALRDAIERVINTDKDDYELVNGFIVTHIIVFTVGGLYSPLQKQAVCDMVEHFTHYNKTIPLNPLDLKYYLSYTFNENIDQTTAIKEIETLLHNNARTNNIVDEHYEDKLYEVLFVINIFAKHTISDTMFALDDYQLLDKLYIEHIEQIKSWLVRGHNKKSLEALGYSFHKYVPSIESGTVLRKTKKVGRNDPCPCGSGKKYKKCCLNRK